MVADPLNVRNVYQQRCAEFKTARSALLRSHATIAWIRLALVLAAVTALVWREVHAGSWASPAGFVAAGSGVLFVLALFHHRRVRERARWYHDLWKVNRNACSRIDRDWASLPEVFAEDVPDEGYVDDLDICGYASVSQLVSAVATPTGAALLQSWLASGAAPDVIRSRQCAVAELAGAIDWRQHFEVSARRSCQLDRAGADRTIAWAESEDDVLRPPWLIWVARGLPFITLLLVALHAMGGPPYVWAVSLGVQVALALASDATAFRVFDRAFAGTGGRIDYRALMRSITSRDFTAPALQDACSEIRAASRSMQKLSRISELIDVRYSHFLHFILQTTTLWDLHLLRALQAWRRAHGAYVRRWFEAIAKLDALQALAALAHENPHWTMPDVRADGPARLQATDLAHPLLHPSKAVANNVTVGPPGTFLFVTGSNMSGKSTLLRAIGTNTALALAGAPVAASSMALSCVRLHTSMHVKDSLASGMSQFMAELARMKRILEAARVTASAPVLYLFDEVMQGTNAMERQVAVRRVLSDLLAHGAIGAIATHDLTLADTPHLRNAALAVHFTETIETREDTPSMSFDYELRPGLATSANALQLMTLMGITSDSGTSLPVNRGIDTAAGTSHSDQS